MKEHVFRTDRPARETPSKALPDGLITGNGDLTVTLAGTSDRVKLYIGKADFWKADGRVYTSERGGIAPLPELPRPGGRFFGKTAPERLRASAKSGIMGTQTTRR